MSAQLPGVSLVLGGAASGKTAFAETLVTGTGRERVYIASAEAHDDEMRAKIDAHREARGPGWHTVEAPLDAGRTLAAIAGGSRSARANSVRAFNQFEKWFSSAW